MDKLSSIKIDQLTFWLPFKPELENRRNIIEFFDSIFHFSKVFQHTEIKGGLNGYSERLVYDDSISILWNFERLDMGLLLMFTASGKLKYEQLGPLYGLEVDWLNLIKAVVALGGHLTRIDIASDFINYEFSTDLIGQNLLSEKYFFKNRAKKTISLNRIKLISDNGRIQTVYVGSRSSDAYLRIYNKQLEQLKRRGPFLALAKNCTSWTRFEGELKGELARLVGRKIASLSKSTDLNPFLSTILAVQWELCVSKDKCSPEWLELKNLSDNESPKLSLYANVSFELNKKIEWFFSGGALNTLYIISDVYGKEGLNSFLEVTSKHLFSSNMKKGRKLKKQIEILKDSSDNLSLDDFLEQVKSLLNSQK